jgi:hypothetical protein
MASKITREKNHVVKTYLSAARALEHAARQFKCAKPYGAHLVALEISPQLLLSQAAQLLDHARETAASDPNLAVAWDGELDLEV